MEERGTNFFTELNGAFATFFSLAYILAVNPRILAESGGPCVPPDGNIFAPEYEECMSDVKKEFITATAIASMVGCFLMGILGNLPIALAPGMGLNAYFTYSVVGWRGTGSISYQAAVTAVAIEGVIFFVLAITGVRFAIIRLIPEPIKTATPAAIGAFLAHLGLQTAEGIGVVVADVATAVTLGGCPEDRRTNMTSYTEACEEDGNKCVFSDAYTCDDLGGIMQSWTTWIGIGGLVIMAILLAYKFKGAFLVGIAIVTGASWFRDTAVTYFPRTYDGDSRFDYFQQYVSIESMDNILTPYTGDLGEVWVALFTFLYVDFLDTSGTLLALTWSMGIADRETGDFPGSRFAFASDAIATVVGSVFGLSPVTSYIESGAGVEVGAKTGLTAVFVGIFFLCSIFFAPIIASIPPWATGGSLIIVGALMARSLGKIKWHIPSHAISAFVTVIMMPLTYSIAYGLIAGIAIFIIIEGTMLILSFVGIKKPVYEEGDMFGGKTASITTEKDSSPAKEMPEETEMEKAPTAIKTGGDESDFEGSV
eukprot:CAMPEP_0178924094 /NCGR_PEP_ID=MMETSP0786-20121207/17127_1 /TAXON_ID=186022 /ORGANISM="Thalassionema frauenfeldii, Strain CCMP 1798" /LENGTH=537 /DNA_ID=CAMNT_0020598749 /DNA_START=107 /DNA_END=1720 /DNA_ORIENTATION=-